MLVLEPSLFAVRRGQQWIRRAVDSSVRTLAVSATAANEFRYPDSPALAPFRASGFWWRPGQEVDPDLTLTLTPLDQPIPAGYWTTRDPYEPAIRIVFETIGGMEDAVLASRRFEFFSLAVSVGVEVLLTGRDDYGIALDALRAELGDALAESLARRVRYLARLDASHGRPRLLVFDAGLGAAR